MEKQIEKIEERIKKKEEQIARTEERLKKQKQQLTDLHDQKKAKEVENLLEVLAENDMGIEEATQFLANKPLKNNQENQQNQNNNESNNNSYNH